MARSDGAPVVVPVVLVTEDASTGFLLSAGSPLPDGGRRAGLLGHSYGAQLIGLNTRQHTGWLEVGDSGAVYAPHTETGDQRRTREAGGQGIAKLRLALKAAAQLPIT